MILLGWTLHAVIAALVFSSLLVLAEQLRAAALVRRRAPPKPTVRRGLI
jgi:hypothetical protein